MDKTRRNATAAEPIMCVLAWARAPDIFLTQVSEKPFAFIWIKS